MRRAHRSIPDAWSRIGALTRAGFVAIALLFTTAGPAATQSTPFGKNKVQYDQFDWRLLESRHFRLYFYEGEEELAQQALRLAEDGYAALRARFAHDVRRPIPLIIFSSHHHFEQTNVTPYFLPEGVAGLTEFAKGRVLIPYNGSLHEFGTTIWHELVHVFQLSLAERQGREHFRPSPLTPPLWFIEGQAVHWSEEPDAEADMILRDMVTSGTLPSIGEFWRYEGGYLTYKLGQSVLAYVADTWGDDRIRLLQDRLWAHERFADVIEDVLGLREEELSARWAHHLRRRYYPEIGRGEPAAFAARALTNRGGADFKPLPLPPGLAGLPEHFAFLSPRDGFTNIYTASRDGRRPEDDVRTLVEGERRPEFESFHAYRSRMDVSADGLLLFVAQHEGRDQVNVYSIPKRRVIDRFAFPGLTGIASPAWAGGTRRLLFSGLSRDGYLDLYLYDRGLARLTRLTHDRYADHDPAFCAWENAVIWSSDRCAGGDDGARNLFLLELETGDIRYLTRGAWRDLAPACDSTRREILFVSDREGFHDVHRVDTNGVGGRLTSTLEGILDPRPIPGENAFLATVYRGGRFEVRRFARPDTMPALWARAEADTTRPWDWQAIGRPVASRRADYRTRFSLDVAQGGVLVDPGMRTGEGLMAAFSDLMGNHLLIVGIGNSTFSEADFLESFSAGVTYVNLSRRLNYGLSAFHSAGEYYDPLGYPYFERRAGAGVLLRYPFDKFQRIETHHSIAYSETDRSFTGFRRRAPIGVHSISYVRDTALWHSTGPLDGQRLNVTVGLNLNLRVGEPETTLLFGEWARYQRLGLLSCYATRLQGRWSEGENPEVFLLGGSHSMRAWPRAGLSGKRSLLLNQEVRFPLLRGAVLGLPPGNLELPGVQGAAFFDTGSAWGEGWPPPWKGSYGVGLRMGFGGFLVLRLDFGRRTDFSAWPARTHTDFFIGWNY